MSAPPKWRQPPSSWSPFDYDRITPRRTALYLCFRLLRKAKAASPSLTRGALADSRLLGLDQNRRWRLVCWVCHSIQQHLPAMRSSSSASILDRGVLIYLPDRCRLASRAVNPV